MTLFDILNFRSIFFRLRFGELRSKYTGRWNFLSMEEMERVLFANQGLRLREAEDDLASDLGQRKTSNPILRRSTSI